MGGVAERALSRCEPDNREIVANDLAREVCRARMKEELKGQVQAPGFGHRGPGFPGEGSPRFGPQRERKVPGGEGP